MTSSSRRRARRRLALEPTRILKRGDVVRTGANGRVRLARTEESVFIGPNTIASIAKRPTPGMRTTVLLERGSSEFQIRKRSKAHFSVETPYLVAIVKGTTFKVTVGGRSARVSVTEGKVQVKSLVSGEYTDIVAGQSAVVNSSGDLDVSGKGSKSPIEQGQPRAPMSLGLSLGSNGVGNVGIGAAGRGGTDAGRRQLQRQRVRRRHRGGRERECQCRRYRHRGRRQHQCRRRRPRRSA